MGILDIFRTNKNQFTSDKTDDEKCNVENLKKMCTDFLNDDNTVEEIVHMLYTFVVVLMHEKNLEETRVIYQEMLTKTCNIYS